MNVLICRYIDRILSDDHLNQSEIVYSFLNPCPEYYSRIKHLGNSSEPEPFSKISKKLFGIAKNSPVDEFNNKSIGLRNIYMKNNDAESEIKEAGGNKRSRNSKSVFPASISSFFNDSNDSLSIQGEQPVEWKRDSKG